MPRTRFGKSGWFLFGLVIVLSYCTYFHNYDYPAGFFWDENYHIASAQKYLNGVFFMEPHPPLGKMLIAAGEKLFHFNEANDQFISTNFANGDDLPEGFSFAGYRLFPVLLGWLTAPIFFLIFLLITRKAITATLLSFLYIFDNAMIVHLRGAMLEGLLIFFIAAQILAFLLILKWKNRRYAFMLTSLFLGIAFGAGFTTKLTALITILLLPALLWNFWPDWRKFLKLLFAFLVGFLIVFIGVWSLHFSIASTVNPELEVNGYYKASEEYKNILKTQKTDSPLAFPIMLADHLHYSITYSAGVPRLDLCKKDENGSPFFLWPLGARSINYRWSSVGDGYRYLYLQINPIIWWTSFLGVLTAAALLLCSFICPLRTKLKHRFILTTFLALYVGYMAAIAQVGRVMYLHHYFPPLLFSFVLFGTVIVEMRQIGSWRLTDRRRTLLCLALGICIFLSFQFYRPLTYQNQTLTNEQLQSRSLLRIWNLRCATCERDDPLVIPRECNP